MISNEKLISWAKQAITIQKTNGQSYRDYWVFITSVKTVILMET